MKRKTVWRLCAAIGAALQIVGWIADIWILGIVGGLGCTIGTFMVAIRNIEESGAQQSDKSDIHKET